MSVASVKKAYTTIIAEMAERNGGRITPEEIVSEARKPESPLHEYFDWDDASAAEKHRIDRARALIRSCEVKITVETKTVSTVGYVRDPKAETSETGYLSIQKVRTEKDVARDVIVSELTRVKSALTRAENLAIALGLLGEIDHIKQDVAALLSRVANAETHDKAA